MWAGSRDLPTLVNSLKRWRSLLNLQALSMLTLAALTRFFHINFNFDASSVNIQSTLNTFATFAFSARALRELSVWRIRHATHVATGTGS